MQAQAGDVTEAKQTAMEIINVSQKASAQVHIARAQAQAGDIAGAKQTAIAITDDSDKAEAHVKIARKLVMRERAAKKQ